MKATVRAVLPGSPSTYQSWVVRGRTEEVLKDRVRLKVEDLVKKGWRVWEVSWKLLDER